MPRFERYITLGTVRDRTTLPVQTTIYTRAGKVVGWGELKTKRRITINRILFSNLPAFSLGSGRETGISNWEFSSIPIQALSRHVVNNLKKSREKFRNTQSRKAKRRRRRRLDSFQASFKFTPIYSPDTDTQQYEEREKKERPTRP